MPEAHAIFGVWRHHARRWAVVGTTAAVGSVNAANAIAASYDEGYNDATTAQHQAAAAQQPPPPATGGKPLPLGTVAQCLSPSCTSTPVGGQMLMAVIHNRYQEQGSLLSVASITANVSFSAGVGAQAGLGDQSNYASNLVPLSANALYEENPTISYTPVASEKYLRRVMSPLPLPLLASLAGSAIYPAPLYTMLVASVDGIRNQDFGDSSHTPDPRFQRFVTLMSSLSSAQVLHWVDDPDRADHPGDALALMIDHYAPRHTAEVGELLALLGLDRPRDSAEPILVPVALTLYRGDRPGIVLRTRSVYRLVEMLSAAIELPPDDQRRGITQDYPPAGELGSRLRVHWSATRPVRAAVAVNHRGGWFYIRDDDLVTKSYFRLLGALWSVSVAESTAKMASTPVLTVPVGR